MIGFVVIKKRFCKEDIEQNKTFVFLYFFDTEPKGRESFELSCDVDGFQVCPATVPLLEAK